MPADRLVKLPDGVADRVAATLMLKGLTVQYLFRQTCKLKAGDTILFHAAAGGVGLIACQWARALGVTMIGTVGSDEKAALAKANGCTHTIVYTRENFVERVKALTGGKGVPVVYDGVGKDTFPGSLDCLSPRGMWVCFGNVVGSGSAVRHPAACRRRDRCTRRGRRSRPTRQSARTWSRWPASCSSSCAPARSSASRARQFALKDAAEAHRALRIADDDRGDDPAAVKSLQRWLSSAARSAEARPRHEAERAVAGRDARVGGGAVHADREAQRSLRIDAAARATRRRSPRARRRSRRSRVPDCRSR